MKNKDIVDNLSTPFVNGLVYIFNLCAYCGEVIRRDCGKNHVSGRIVESVEKLSPLFVDNFMEAISQVQTVEKLSTEIVDKSMAIKISCMKTSYPQ